MYKLCIITSAGDVLFSWQSVWVSVCVQSISESYERIVMKFSGVVGHGPRNALLDFCGDLSHKEFVDVDRDPDRGFLKSILYLLHCSIVISVDSQE